LKPKVLGFFEIFFKKFRKINFKNKILKINVFFLQFFYHAELSELLPTMSNSNKIKIVFTEILHKRLSKLYYLYLKNKFFFRGNLQAISQNLKNFARAKFLNSTTNNLCSKNFLVKKFIHNKCIEFNPLNLVIFTQRIVLLTDFSFSCKNYLIDFLPFLKIILSFFKIFLIELLTSNFLSQNKQNYYLIILLSFFLKFNFILVKLLEKKQVSYNFNYKNITFKKHLFLLLQKKAKTHIYYNFLYSNCTLLNTEIAYRTTSKSFFIKRYLIKNKFSNLNIKVYNLMQ